MSGVARRLDENARVVLPSEMRRAIGVGAGDLVDCRLVGRSIIVSKAEPSCAICAATDVPFFDVGDGRLCGACVAEAAKALA